MTCLNRIRDALLAVTAEVYHFHAHKPSPPYIVWAEDGAGAVVVKDIVRRGTYAGVPARRIHAGEMK